LQAQALQKLVLELPQTQEQVSEPSQIIHPLLVQERLQKEAQVPPRVVQKLMLQEREQRQIIHLSEQELDFQTNHPLELPLAVQMQELVEEQHRILQNLQLRVQQV
jgi:hypothetical protein